MTEIRKTYAFVLPWSLDHEGGVNEVVRNLINEFRLAGRSTRYLSRTTGPPRGPWLSAAWMVGAPPIADMKSAKVVVGVAGFRDHDAPEAPSVGCSERKETANP
jgi:hypothetical protein